MAVLFRDFYYIDAEMGRAARGDLLVEGGRIARLGKDLPEPPGGETESLLFCLQAALGSGVLFFGFGYLVARKMMAGAKIGNPVGFPVLLRLSEISVPKGFLF